MKTSLTPEESARLPEIRDKWLRIGLRTGNEDNPQPKAWDAIKRAYVVAGRTAPKLWIWMPSPLHAALACVFLKNAQVRAQVSAQVLDQVSAQVLDQVSAQVLDQVSAQVLDQVSDQVLAQVSAQVLDQVSDQVRDQVSDQVLAQVSDQVRAQVSDQVLAQVSDQVRAQVRDQLKEFAGWFFWYQPGQFDAFWLSFYEAFKDSCDFAKLQPLAQVAENCAFAMMFPDIVVFSARPTVIARDGQNRLHCENGPAVAFGDDFTVHAIHGVRVRRYIVERPSEITIEAIDAESNAEIRRVMVERFGQSRYLLESGAKEVHRDDFGILYRKEIPGDEPLVMVKVVNSTPEPDGSFKDYFLRVPPDITRARQAVAWTFNVPENQYQPVMET